tara:strand:+ start:3225 stop:3674 length:450 start_codon:yes stop_codon:yes gene_type:complete
MITSKIINIEKQSKPFITNDGKTLYVFQLKMENGDIGGLFKTTENPYVSVGDTINYTKTEHGNIKIQRDGFGSSNKENFNYTKDEKTKIFDAKDRRISKLAIIRDTIQLVCHDKLQINEMQPFAENLLNWVYDKQGVKDFEFTDDKIPF